MADLKSALLYVSGMYKTGFMWSVSIDETIIVRYARRMYVWRGVCTNTTAWLLVPQI